MPTSKYTKKELKELYKSMREKYPPKVEDYTYDKYIQDLLEDKIRYVENMSAKEPLDDVVLETMLTSDTFYAEEKFDGIRGDLHFGDFIRSFTRNLSKKTNWFSENTDSLPHIRDFKYPEFLKGTVLDGEYRVLEGDFKEISSLLNCNFEEALLRQHLTGRKPTFIAFDILYYKGICVMQLPLHRRKMLLRYVIRQLNNEYIINSKYTSNLMKVTITKQHLMCLNEQGADELYPTLAKEVYKNNGGIPQETTPFTIELSKQAWYEFILLNDGEGLMLKNKNAQYFMKRGREYTKYKRFDTWDVIIVGYKEPTEEYTGTEIDTWSYWGMYRQGSLEEIIEGEEPSPYTRDHQVLPLTKHFAKGWVGTIVFGVIVDDKILQDWKKRNPKEQPLTTTVEGNLVLILGEASGFTEEIRQYISENKGDLIGTVVEIKGHERIKKTSKIRHPRFVRFREDKHFTECTWENHQH